MATRMDRRTFLAARLVPATAALAVAAACTGPQGAGGPSAAPAGQAPAGQAPASGSGGGGPLKVGLLLEQTGGFSWYGQENQQGAQLFTDDLNARGGVNGRQVELVVYNNESSPEKSVTGARKLIQQDRVAAIVGLGLVGNAQAVSPVVKDSGPPVYSTSGSYLPDHPMMFAGTVFVGDTQKRALQFLKERNVTKIAMLLTNDATGQVAQGAVGGAAPGLGMEITRTELFDPADVDVTAQLSQIRATSPQAIISWVVGRPLGVVLKGAKQLGIEVPIVTSHGNLSPGFIESIADTQNGPLYMFGTKDLIWRDIPDGDPQKALVVDMQTKHQAKFGKEAGIGTGTAYDGMLLVTEALNKAGGTEPAQVAEALSSLRGVNGVIGTYNLSAQDRRGLDAGAAIPMEIKAGKLLRVA